MPQQRSKTRGSILKTAKRLFGLTGYQSTTLDDIAKFAGLSASTMQSHFENKESLLLETQRTIFENYTPGSPNEINLLSTPCAMHSTP